MAKKKMNRQSDGHKQQQQQEQPTSKVADSQNAIQPHIPTMSETSETLERLKSLNGMLLKETTHRRQQVESLVKAKEGLQSDLTQSEMEKESLVDQLSDLRRKNIELELQRGVLSTFLDTQLSDLTYRCDYITREKAEVESILMKKEADMEILTGKVHELVGSLQNERNTLKEVTLERDTAKRDLDGLVAESNGLKDKVMEMERRDGELKADMEKLRAEGERLKQEADERKTELQVLIGEKELAVKKLADSELIVTEWKEKVDGIQSERNLSEKERKVQLTKIVELEGQVEELNEVLLSKQKEEEALRNEILNLEKAICEATWKEKEMEIVIGSLQEEKETDEQCIKNLKEERDALQMSLMLIEDELQNKQKRMDEIMRERDSIGQLNSSMEDEIVKLRDEARELSNIILKLRETCRGLEEKNEELIFVVDKVKADFSVVKNERDLFKSSMDKQASNVEILSYKVSELEKNLGQTSMELSMMMTQKKELVDKNKVLESHMQSLVEEKVKLLNSLREAKKEFNDLSAKVELAATNSSRAMCMLKDTTAIICQSEDYKDIGAVAVNEKNLEEEIEPFARQLDAIKDAYMKKIKMVEDMEEEITCLQKSFAESQKRKSFLTVLSSATTIFAAASVAYVARGR